MTQHEQRQPLMQFYETDLISEDQLLLALQSKGIPLEACPEDPLKASDQDHYSGVEAVDILAQKAGIRAHHAILDFCSGMGGHTRYLAYR